MITSFNFQPTALIALAIAIAIAIGIGIAIAIADAIAIGIAIGMSSPDDRCTLLSGYYAMPYGIEVLYEVKGPKNCPRDVLDIIRHKCRGPIIWWLIFGCRREGMLIDACNIRAVKQWKVEVFKMDKRGRFGEALCYDDDWNECECNDAELFYVIVKGWREDKDN